ncbi:hypothetical protein F2Q69_00013499 [Brassica cretica]|uniref:Uncharacterized protein n=1 Tax=Brassica cretica TaxID=69181 RepID=A0A8S9QVS2_BRACR|nr:hypothetical protein F2Q69_00013499 [Brassica cretica]
MKWVRYGLQEIASKGKRECMDSRRIDISEELGRYVATELGSSLVATDRANLFGLFSDVSCFLRKVLLLTSSRPFLTPTTWRPSGNKTLFICIKLSRDISVHAWSLSSDRAWLVRGLIAILELVRGWFR